MSANSIFLRICFLQATMMKKAKTKVRRRDTEPSLTFGDQQGAMALSQSSDQTTY